MTAKLARNEHQFQAASEAQTVLGDAVRQLLAVMDLLEEVHAGLWIPIKEDDGALDLEEQLFTEAAPLVFVARSLLPEVSLRPACRQTAQLLAAR